MKARKIATTIYITVEQDRNLRLLSESMSLPMARLIRDGIDLVLAHHEGRLPRQLGLEMPLDAPTQSGA